MFDRSLLPDASFEFVVIADTHHMRVPAGAPTEFESRRLQADRAETALRLAASLDCELVIHMGDLVQAYPEFEGFQSAMAEARSVINQCGLRPIVVPGNHDVGDKPDPTMPTHPVSAGSLAWFDQHVGPAWSSFDHHDVHFVVLNTMILNSDMPQAGEQRQWLESDLRKQAGRRTFMFLHLPPYVGSENEPGLGHYDNVDQPDRRWLLDLVKTHEIELLVAAHVHWRFFDRIGNTRYFVAPSPSFTRPGFGHLFASAPAPEQGRDDAPKLGFFLTRVSDAHIDMHLIRTNGLTRIAPAIADGRARHLLTRHSRALPDSPLGLTLQQPLGPRTDLPLAWPSNVRQPVRNDYPLLACVELGVRHVRVPCTDLADTEQRRSLQMLRDEGVSLIATSLRGDGQDALEWMGRCGDQIDAWEIQVPGGRPGDELLEQIRQLKRRGDTPVVLSPVIPKEHVAGKQHLRTRHAYWLEELDDLDERLRDAGLNVDRVLCRPEPDADLIDTFARIGSASARQAIGAIDVQIELNTVDEARSLRHAATAVFAARSAAGCRVFIEPLIDLDRTMDVCFGLLDTRCNPRPAFHAVRCLNTILHRAPATARVGSGRADLGLLQNQVILQDNALYCLLVDPQQKDRQLDIIAAAAPAKWAASSPCRIHLLADGLVQDCEYRELGHRLGDMDARAVFLVELRRV